MNKVMIIGYLGRDPETRYTPSGATVCEFSVATSEKWRDKQSGEMREETEWFNVVAWGRQAEVCGEYLRKGSRVYIEGKQQTDQWEQDGQKRYRTKLKMDRMEFLSDNRGGGGGGRPSQSIAGHEEAAEKQDTVNAGGDDFDDDIPF